MTAATPATDPDAPERPEVLLWMGGSFRGPFYAMNVGKQTYSLGTPMGGARSPEEARETAKDILARYHPDLVVDIDKMPFHRTGTR